MGTDPLQHNKHNNKKLALTAGQCFEGKEAGQNITKKEPKNTPPKNQERDHGLSVI